MNTRTNAPLRGPVRRSRAFQEYLLRQTPERRAEIVAGERDYEKAQAVPSGPKAARERDFDESMRGFEDLNAI